MRRWLLSILSASSLMVAAHVSFAAVVTIDNTFLNRIYTEAYYASVDSVPATGALVVPRTGALHAEDYGPYGAVTTDLSFSLSSSSFTFDFSQFIPQQMPYCFPGDPFCPPPQDPIPGGGVFVADLAFSVDAPVDYVLSGFFTSIAPEGPNMQLVVELCDNTGGTICGYYPELFRNAQTSSYTPNESFTVGGLGGDDPGYPNFVDGSLTGTLFPGDTYSIHLYAVMGTQPWQTQYSSTTGQLRLAFVPEPGAGLLLVCGLLAMVGLRAHRS